MRVIVVPIGKMIELRDPFTLDNRLKILPITFLFHNDYMLIKL